MAPDMDCFASGVWMFPLIHNLIENKSPEDYNKQKSYEAQKSPRWGWLETSRVSGVSISLTLMFYLLWVLLDTEKVASVNFGLLYHVCVLF